MLYKAKKSTFIINSDLLIDAGMAEAISYAINPESSPKDRDKNPNDEQIRRFYSD